MYTSRSIFDVQTHASGSSGRLPLQPEFITDATSGHVFGWTQDAVMGWNPSDLGQDEYLILSAQGCIRAEDGSPIALSCHTEHYKIGLLAEVAAQNLNSTMQFLLQASSMIRVTDARKAPQA